MNWWKGGNELRKEVQPQFLYRNPRKSFTEALRPRAKGQVMSPSQWSQTAPGMAIIHSG
jgi:hypothetical protein